MAYSKKGFTPESRKRISDATKRTNENKRTPELKKARADYVELQYRYYILGESATDLAHEYNVMPRAMQRVMHMTVGDIV